MKRYLVGFVGLDDEGVPGGPALVGAVHDDDKAVGGRFGTDMDARVLPAQQVLYEGRLAWF